MTHVRENGRIHDVTLRSDQGCSVSTFRFCLDCAQLSEPQVENPKAWSS